MATPKQQLRESIEGLTEGQALQALSLVQQLLQTGQGDSSVGIIPPAVDSPPFADFEPLALSGPPASELLIADRR